MSIDKKEIDLVYCGKETWTNVANTESVRNKCENNKAYYNEIQIR